MISTPAAPIQHPHRLSQPFHVPFREHVASKRHSARPMLLLPPSQPTRGAYITGEHGPAFSGQGGWSGWRQGPYAMPQATARSIDRSLEAGAPEHMLRRKTPNGTLKAGYDGTPVEWASGPPAHKHQLVRKGVREDAAEAALRRQACFLLSGPAASPNMYAGNPFDRGSSGLDTFNQLGQDFGSPASSNRQYIQHPSIFQPADSILYQSLPHGQPMLAGQHAHVPVAMQPSWPRNIEPTASAPHLPYGPYWPNGAFEPYRPTAVRDARNQFARISLNDPHEGQPWNRQERDHERLPVRDSVYLGPALYPGVRADAPPQYQNLRSFNPMPFPDYPRRDGPPTVDDQPGPFFSGVEPLHRLEGLANGASSQQQVLATTSTSPQLQFKEMAVAQAHRTYVLLLAAIQHDRKTNQQVHTGQKKLPSASLFPKPPRHSYPLSIPNSQNNPIPGYRMHRRGQSQTIFNSQPGSVSGLYGISLTSVRHDAQNALDLLRQMAQESGWTWVDAMLLGGCLAYGLENYTEAMALFQKVLDRDSNNVEAMSNLAAAHMTLNHRAEAERLWTEAVKVRPSFFEAVEHLLGLLCAENRSTDAINVIHHVETSLRASSVRDTTSSGFTCHYKLNESPGSLRNPYARANVVQTSGYKSHAAENGRLIALIHAKGNMLYASGNITGAAKAFEEAIMIAVGRTVDGISGLIRQILLAFTSEIRRYKQDEADVSPWETILLLPRTATRTAQLTFPNSSPLPGLGGIADGQPKRAAVAVTSNCLLSLAKIYQDSMSSGGAALGPSGGATGVQDILALYYLSLSLQPSPSTANNVGILLAGVQQSAPNKLSFHLMDKDTPPIAGVVPGTGIALALAYYNYGLQLDKEHAHLYTNLGSLLKDLGQLDLAIRMYEEAVRCDGKFDIALANLANAVKDRGRISDAIGYYKRAVDANADFAEAVCGLANALNSVCGWAGRGGIAFNDRRFDRWHVDEEGMLLDARDSTTPSSGWIGRVVAIVNKQLLDGRSWGKNILAARDVKHLVRNATIHEPSQAQHFLSTIMSWIGKDHEGAKIVRFIERATRQISWQWYQDQYVQQNKQPTEHYLRPQPPAALTVPNAPTVLPFHTFTCPLTASQIRQISQRNGLRISSSTLKAPWLPAHVFKPPPPPSPQLNVGYVSSDFNNHPLAHLMQSVFGMHNPGKVKAFCYATTPSDKSNHRQKIENEAPVFYDASAWPTDRLVNQIVEDKIHILVNLNGYTRGARNEVFAARPAPIQMSFMGFAGTLGAEWCDYLLADETAVPTSTLRPYRDNVTLLDVIQDDNFGDKHGDWVYGENIIYTRDTFFCCDHRQSAPDAQEPHLSWSDELQRRRSMRRDLFPNLPDNMVILGNFNQLYKIEPSTFRTWLRILQAVPQAVLWLLRFPDLGEHNLRAMAMKWSTPDVSNRIIFTDVAPKHQHISRARICDLFLDTPECNAHTTSADVLWSGTPLLTYPRYEFKMCSRMAASILQGAMPRGRAGQQAAKDLTASSDEEYEKRAIELASDLVEVFSGNRDNCRVLEIRKLLYEGRWHSPLFDTQRWTSDLEEAYEIAWNHWVNGEGGDIYL